MLLLDPLDATRSFINKNYNEVTILAGVLIKSSPYYGFITSPFYDHDNINKSDTTLTYFNIPHYGIFALRKKKNNLFDDDSDNFSVERVKSSKRKSNENDNHSLKLIVSRSREEKLKQILKPMLSKDMINKLQIYNGMGHRSIKMLEEDYYFMTTKSFFGYWDICATDALFREIGGGCFSLNGKTIDYSKAKEMETNQFDIIIGENRSKMDFYVKKLKDLCL